MIEAPHDVEVAAYTRERLLSELREVLASDGRVRLAILFGSWAKGTEHEDSDLDLAIDAHPSDLPAIAGRISNALGLEVDVVSVWTDSIPLLDQIVSHGIMVFEAERGALASWRTQSLLRLETDRPWYRRMREAWLARVEKKGLDHG